MAAVSRQKNIRMDVKTGLHSLEESLEVIEANLDMCRKARQTLRAKIVERTSETDMTETESTTKMAEVIATSPIRVIKWKRKKDKNKEQEEIRENGTFFQTNGTKYGERTRK